MGKIKIESTVGAKIYANEKELGLIKREDKVSLMNKKKDILRERQI